MAIIITKNEYIQLVAICIFFGILIGAIGTSAFNEKRHIRDEISKLRERASEGLVYVDSQSRIYKCDIK